MKNLFRLIASLCLLGPLVSGTSPANAESVTPEACTEIFSISATNQSGALVAGEILSVDVAAQQDGWKVWYAFDNSSPRPGVLNLCALTNAQVDVSRENYGSGFDANLKAGDKITVSYIAQGSSATQIYQHLLTAEQALAANNKTISTLPNLVVSSTTQVPVTIKDSAGTAQANAPWELYEEVTNFENGESWTENQYVSYGTTDANGRVQVSGLANGKYLLNTYPGDNPSPNAMRTKVTFNVTGGVATFDSPNVVSNVLTLSNANVKFRLVDENQNPFSTQTLNEISPYIDNGENYIEEEALSRRSDGYFLANLPDSTGYQISVEAGGESGYVGTRFTLEVVSGVATFKKGDVTMANTSLVLDKANVAFKAQDLAGNSVRWPSISVFSASTCTTEETITNIDDCDPESKWVPASQNGIGMAKLTNGTYWVSMDPWSAGFESKGTLSKFTITDGVVSSVDGFARRVAADDSNAFLGTETLVLSSRPANFKAIITSESGVAINGGWTSSEPICEECSVGEFEHSSSEIDSSGRMGLYLPSAPSGTTKTYKIHVSPSDRYSETAAESSFIATVNDLGEVTAVTPPSQLPENVSSPTNGLWTLRLPEPNFSGKVLMPTGTDIVRYTNFDAQKWIDGQYNHVDDMPNIYTNEDGEFSGYFTPGRYKITVNPPYDLANVAYKDYEIVIAENGDACLFDGENSSTCTTPVARGSFELRLSTPNVSGVITKGGVTLTRDLVENANVELRKWNSEHSYWDWERWSQVAGDGSYSFNIQSPGTYQIVVNPGYVEGYTSGYEYLVVGESQNGLTFCKIPEPGLDTLSRATCGGNTANPGPLAANIALQRSNLQANVTVPVGFEGWVYAYTSKIFEVPGSGERHMHSSSLDFRQVGETNVYTGFSSLSDNNGNPAKYKIEFDAQSDSDESLPLARTKSYVWAYNFDTTDSEIEICPEKFYAKVAQTCASGRLIDSSTPMNVQLTSGNLAGAVKTPAGDPVPHAWLQVQKWEQSTWSGEYHNWNWIDLYASANREGAFALNIEESGYYKLQTRQQWGGKLPFADSISLLKVDENGDWCLIDGEIANYSANEAPTSNTNCELSRDNDLTDEVSGLSIKLKDPKITGTVKLVSGAPANNSYIWVRKWNSTYNYYEYSDYATTNEDGKFYINPSDGDYQLELNPGWEDRNSEIGYSRNLCLGAEEPEDRPSSPEQCAPTHNLSEQFLAPNINGIVCPAGEMQDNCTEDGVRYSWIELREQGNASADQPEYWSWIEGTSTDSEGKFALRLTAGTVDEPKLYSMRVYPNDQDEQGVGKRIFVSVGESDGTTVCKTGTALSDLATVAGGCSSLRIGLLSPNTSGALTYNNSNLLPPLEQQFMKHSWVSIFTEGYQSYVVGAPTNSQGKFAAVLEDGTYFLDAYSNSSIAARSSLRLTVKVATVGGTTTVSWKYRNQADDSYVDSPINADFDFVPPNVKITLSESLTASHVILIKDLDPDSSTREQPRRFVSNGTLASGVLTKDKTYSIKIVANYQEALTGTCEISSATITVAEGDMLGDIALADEFDLSDCSPLP